MLVVAEQRLLPHLLREGSCVLAPHAACTACTACALSCVCQALLQTTPQHMSATAPTAIMPHTAHHSTHSLLLTERKAKQSKAQHGMACMKSSAWTPTRPHTIHTSSWPGSNPSTPPTLARSIQITNAKAHPPMHTPTRNTNPTHCGRNRRRRASGHFPALENRPFD